MTFSDTSAIYAVLDSVDENHPRAGLAWLRLLDSGEPLITTNYVVVECCALTQRRLGLPALRALQDEILPMMTIHWIDKAAHTTAVNALLVANRSKLSLVDCSSFVVMRQLGLQSAFAFDRHFDQEGFHFPKAGGSNSDHAG
jgi:predicted nucleic acid-binding protein